MRIAVIGAGARGTLLARLARRYAPWVEICAVAEPRPGAREHFAAEFGIPEDGAFGHWKDLLGSKISCDAAIIATMDRDHRAPAEAAMERGWNLLLEKPLAAEWEDCAAIEAAQRRSGIILSVCHSLRYHQAYQKVREIIRSGALGRLMTLDLMEQVGYWHFSHSFVRGNWRREDQSTFVLLAKSCHDMDMLSWLAERPCLSASSVGHLSHFRMERMPSAATAMCADGCPVADCAFDARKIYSPGGPGWDFVADRAGVLGESPAQAQKAMLSNNFGRCVYRCDNDVADHQGVLLEFEDGLVATFTLTAFTQDCRRKLRAQGTGGEIEMQEEAAGQRIRWRSFAAAEAAELFLPAEDGTHGGADARLVAAWLEDLHAGRAGAILSDAQASLASHRIAFAAEESRKRGLRVAIEPAGPLGGL
jgi:predicted dehydrogenase